eukprot:TRINITY_DN3151_c0_g1_i3.p2 TRINITY_DN3151_c0_g1~~TRINITY_DN3151_c0_g1_i3.p2  ORF type:complete len:110 (+),score=31.90 TRINITY_DN3151_c0_g1_i3:141-470(+)
MLFCRNCANMLLLEQGPSNYLRFYCQTCPYVFPIKVDISYKLPLKRKEIDPVFGGPEAWKGVDQTETVCPCCNNNRAYFIQLQTRSADEPMTIFYKCTFIDCSNVWREN